MRYLRVASLIADIEDRLRELGEIPRQVTRARRSVELAAKSGKLVYGVTTGFGALKSVKISENETEELQRNLLRSHAAGVGEPIPRTITEIMLGLKVHALALGYSGASPHVIEFLRSCALKRVTPYVPSRGSVGASGDLAPLAHLGLLTLGEGECWGRDGSPLSTRLALRRASLKPISLGAKDGLAIVNGTQMMSAYGAYVLSRARNLTTSADIIAATSLDALRGSVVPFRKEFFDARPHPGHGEVSKNMRALLRGSEIVVSHAQCDKVQDPYSLRCVPQVHGAVRDALRHAEDVVEREINSATDNPLVFGDDEIASGGNFHGEPLALVLDYAATALSELASIAERRIYLLLDGHDELPRFLIQDAGLHSGFMIAQYAAAALVSENKVLAHPASVDSIPTCRGQEDHVSMGSISALKLLDVFANVERVLGIELLLACQALEFRRPLRSSDSVERVLREVRKHIPFIRKDRVLSPLMMKAQQLIADGVVVSAAARHAPGLI